MHKWPPKPFTDDFLKQVKESRKMLDANPVPKEIEEFNPQSWLKKTFGLGKNGNG